MRARSPSSHLKSSNLNGFNGLLGGEISADAAVGTVNLFAVFNLMLFSYENNNEKQGFPSSKIGFAPRDAFRGSAS